MKKQLLLLVLMMLPMVASAHDIEVQNADGVTIYYNYINNGTELEVTYQGSKYNSYSNEYQGNVAIPEEVTYMNRTRKVTSIGNYAFYGCSGLTSITIPNSVTSIGSGAFWYCSGLTSITIPNSVTSIRFSAFSGCSGLTSITIPNSVTSIENYAFQYCSGLTSVTIPNSVTSIGVMAFDSCSGLTSVTIPNSVTSIGFMAFASCKNLTSITIPNSVTSISQPAFNGCTGLTSMKVDSGNTKYDSRDNCNAIIETESNTLIAGCKNTTIPNNVTCIGDSAFYDGYSLTSIIIPNSVTSIGLSAFYFCYGLTQVIIGNGVKSIEKKAFSRCSNIQDMYLYADWIPTTGTDVFYSSYTSYITTLHVPASLLSLYKSTSPWKDFKEIVALTDSDPKPDVTEVNAVRNIEDNKVVIYNLNGVRLNEPQKGINIINGKKYVEK